MDSKLNVRSFRPSEEFENLQHINQVQFVLLQGLQKENVELREKIKHLELVLSQKIQLIEN